MRRNRLAVGGSVALWLLAGTASAGLDSWTARGPAAGYANAFGFDPNDAQIVFVASDSALVFRSTNGGGSFGAFDTGLLHNGDQADLTSIAVDPTDGQHVCVGSAFRGVACSGDGGATWSRVSTGLPDGSANTQYPEEYASIGQLVFDASGNLYAHSSMARPGYVFDEYGVYRLDAGSSTWQAWNTGLPEIPRIGASSISGDVLKLVRSTSGAVYAALVYTFQPSPPISAVAAFAAGSTGWGMASGADKYLINVIGFAVDASGTPYVSSGDYALIDKWSGGAWTGAHANNAGRTLVVTPSGDLFASGNGDSQIYTLPAAANTGAWSTQSTDFGQFGTLPDNRTFKLALSPSNVLFAGAFNGGVGTGAYASPVASPAWKRVLASARLGGPLVPAGGSSWYMMGGGTLGRSDDGGATWAPVELANAPTFEWRSLLADPADPDTVLVGMNYGGLWRGTVGGGFAQAGVPTGTTVEALATDGARIFAATSGGLEASDDHGTSFGAAGTGLPAVAASWVVVDAAHPAYVYVGTQQGVFRSTDHGASWSSAGGITSAPLAFDPLDASVVYAPDPFGNGVARSTDGGKTFAAAGPGQPTWAPTAIVTDPTRPGVLYAAYQSGHGVYRSVDGASTWTELNPGLPTAAMNDLVSLALDPQDPNRLLGATLPAFDVSALWELTQSSVPAGGADAGTDAGADASTGDADASGDAGIDAVADASGEAETGASADAGVDATLDANGDTGGGGSADAAVDAPVADGGAKDGSAADAAVPPSPAPAGGGGGGDSGCAVATRAPRGRSFAWLALGALAVARRRRRARR